MSSSPASASIDPAAALSIFQQAKIVCTRDGGALWGRSLCGPILLVDPTDRSAVANETDGKGALKPSNGVFVGSYPEPAAIANTATEWSGKRWTEIIWPVHQASDFFAPLERNRWTALIGQQPTGTAKLRVLLGHELFHRIQPSLGLTRPEAANSHLDTLEGRYFLQLEWRALADALAARSAGARRRAIEDALLFRHERYRLFPDAAAHEGALEIDEGIAEYTGVKVGLTTSEERTRYAIYDLALFVQAPTFVRSFAYATGPAYGLLLDRADPQWRTRLQSGRRLDELLSAALKLPLPNARDLRAREAVYGGAALRSCEVARDVKRKQHMAALRARLIDGPVLTLPLRNSSYQFNPQTVEALDGIGTVYPTLHIADDWGVLEVDSGGALVDKDMTRVTVSAQGIDLGHAAGSGWHLTLQKGWSIAPGPRSGDLVVQRAQTGGKM